MPLDTGAEFLRQITGDDGAIDLARAGLAIALDDYPDLDLDHYLARLDDLARRVRERAGSDDSSAGLLAALEHTLFGVEGFNGNTADYYDPRNSYLNQVMDRRQGIPITLSVLYLEVAHRAGVWVEPVGFPSHFLLSWGRGEARRFIDPFHGGRRYSSDDLMARLGALVGSEQAQALFPQAVAVVPHREVVARMLRNLKLIHAQSGDWERALPVSHRLVALEGLSSTELRDRGRILEHLEAHRAAVADYEGYLEHHPQAEDAQAVEARLSTLRSQVRRLN